jgi:hypothetical protein
MTEPDKWAGGAVTPHTRDYIERLEQLCHDLATELEDALLVGVERGPALTRYREFTFHGHKPVEHDD